MTEALVNLGHTILWLLAVLGVSVLVMCIIFVWVVIIYLLKEQ